jgi:hypothetical protein
LLQLAEKFLRTKHSNSFAEFNLEKAVGNTSIVVDGLFHLKKSWSQPEQKA